MRRGWVQRWRGARADREGGAVLVEAVLIIPIIVTLVFGAIEFGFAFNEQGTVRAATRSAARATSASPAAEADDFYAAALNSLDTSVTNLATGEPQFVEIYQAEETGGGEFVRPGSCATNCMRFEYLDDHFETVGGGDPWDVDERDACSPDNTDRVGIYLEVDHEMLTRIDEINLTSNTIMALEPSPGADC
jgi:hypothetical protein